jgi:O-glycosyl hydrolase
VPARPLALARSDLSYVDIHWYVPTVAELDRQLAGGEGVNIEFEELLRVCEERGKPLFCGEVGFIREWHDSAAEVAELAPKAIGRMMKRGFRGYCYWTYDTEEQEPLYHAMTDGGVIFRALAEMNTDGSP